MASAKHGYPINVFFPNRQAEEPEVSVLLTCRIIKDTAFFYSGIPLEGKEAALMRLKTPQNRSI
jgi:hypothetical protein